MPCFSSQSITQQQAGAAGATETVSASEGYGSLAECLEACGEGACCDGGTCSVVPRCNCRTDMGHTFAGVGTTCDPNPCNPLP